MGADFAGDAVNAGQGRHRHDEEVYRKQTQNQKHPADFIFEDIDEGGASAERVVGVGHLDQDKMKADGKQNQKGQTQAQSQPEYFFAPRFAKGEISNG